MTRLIPALIVVALAGTAAAQTTPQTTLRDQPTYADPAYTAPVTMQGGAVGSPNVYDGPADETPRDPYDPELGVTASLNASIAERDREIEAANARAEAEYEAALMANSDQIARDRADHDAALAAHQETIARQEAEYAAQMEAWRRCSAGERAFCAQFEPKAY